jgi:hypothetical protein
MPPVGCISIGPVSPSLSLITWRAALARSRLRTSIMSFWTV